MTKMDNKPRKWLVAGLLSLMVPGLGQIYNGQARKGIFFLFLPLFYLPLIVFLLYSDKVLFILVISALLSAIFYILVIGDSIRTALKYKTDYHLKKYNKFLIYLGIITIVFTLNSAISNLVKNNLFKAYRIASAGSEPTLLKGDLVLIDRRASARKAKRGSLVVFEYPEDPSKEFIQRVVAIGGDTVEIIDKLLIVNSEPVKENFVIHKADKIVSAEKKPRENFGLMTLPEKTCFMLGDNRDHSYDSRYWGVVENSKIKGTLRCIYWSWDRNKQAVRWDRIGKIVQ